MIASGKTETSECSSYELFKSFGSEFNLKLKILQSQNSTSNDKFRGMFKKKRMIFITLSLFSSFQFWSLSTLHRRCKMLNLTLSDDKSRRTLV